MRDMSGIAEHRPLPGPVDRETFHDAQIRHRRASWWFTALSALAVGLTGIALSAVISPLLYAFAILLLDVVNLVVPTPDPFGALAGWDGETVPPAAVAALVVALVLPGSVALLLAWAGVRRLVRGGGAAAMVEALGARPPRSGVLEEQQVVNVVGEVAVAAGVPAPSVVVLDSPLANAVAVGSRLDDCTVVVTTGLLERLDREETQGVLASVVASAGNGDLRIGATILSVYQTFGLVATVLRAPGEKGPRRTFLRLVRMAFRRPGADGAATAAALLAEAGTAPEPSTAPVPTGVRLFLQMPFSLAAMAFETTVSIWSFCLIDPVLRRAWIRRRHLADAAAVALTRNPDGVARGVALLDRAPDGADWAAHLFAGGDPGESSAGKVSMRAYHPTAADRVDRLRAMGASVDQPLRARSAAGSRAVVVFAVLTSPCWVSLLVVFLALPLLITGITLFLDVLYVGVPVAGLHALLRAIGR